MINKSVFKRQQKVQTQIVCFIFSIALFIRAVSDGSNELAFVYGSTFLVTTLVILLPSDSYIKININRVFWLDYAILFVFFVLFLFAFISDAGVVWLIALGFPFYFFTKKLSLKILNLSNSDIWGDS